MRKFAIALVAVAAVGLAFSAADARPKATSVKSVTVEKDKGGKGIPDAPTDFAMTPSFGKLHLTWNGDPETTSHYKIYEKIGSYPWSTEPVVVYEPTHFYDRAIQAHLYEWNTTQYKIEACSLEGCSDPDPVIASTPAMSVGAIAELMAPDTEDDDYFGYAVAVNGDGNTIVVGAPMEDGVDNAIQNSGAAYIFEKDEAGNWGYKATLRPEAPYIDTWDQFGGAVDIDKAGNRIAIGCPFEDGTNMGVNMPPNNNGQTFNAGAVYLFKRNASGDFEFEAYIKSLNTGEADFFGHAVALSQDGSVLGVGAPNEDSGSGVLPGNNAIGNSGAAYAYIYNNGAWQSSGYIKSLDPELNAGFGTSIDVKGSSGGVSTGVGRDISVSRAGIQVMVGAPYKNGDYTNQGDRGEVYLFSKGGTMILETSLFFPLAYASSGYQQYRVIRSPNPENGEQFGFAVAFASGKQIIGAPGKNALLPDNSTGDNVGQVYVIGGTAPSDTKVVPVPQNGRSAGDKFGLSVAATKVGDHWHVIGGAPYEDGDTVGVNNVGPIYFDTVANSGASWFYRFPVSPGAGTYIKTPTAEADRYFGMKVSISQDGGTLVIGGHGSSRVYVY